MSAAPPDPATWNRAINLVITDLQTEHTRCQERIQRYTTSLTEVENRELIVAYLNDRLEQFELLIRRFRTYRVVEPPQ